MTAAVVIAVALLGLGLAAAWVRQEEAAGARVAAFAGCGLGLVTALVAALLAGKSGVDAIAIALVGGAVLPLALLGQVRLVRSLAARR